jgi:transposase-like protein
MPVVKYRIDKSKAGGNTWWSDKQKYEAVAAYLLIGNLAQVSRMSGIPDITLRKWKAQPWWAEAEQEVKRASKLQLSGKLTKAIQLANLAVEDRLENGEFVFNPKTGELTRRPVSADTAVKVLNTLIDKQLVLEKHADENTHVTQEGVAERLEKIAHELLKFTKQPTGDVIDVVPVCSEPGEEEAEATISKAEVKEASV